MGMLGPIEWDGDPEDLFRLLELLGGRRLRKRNEQNSKNPADYPRSVKITDDKILMQLWAIEKLWTDHKKERERMELIEAKLLALRKEIFLDLREAYPDVDGDGGMGWRLWKNEFYAVALPDEESTNEDDEA